MDDLCRNNRPLMPQRLKPGAVIGVAAPAGPVEPFKLQKGIDILEKLGFSVVSSERVLQQDGYLAGSDEQRAGHLNQLFADDEIDAIIFARGGYGSLRLLPLIDFDNIRRHPKWCIGFSDISGLLASFYLKCGLISIHGPMVTTLNDLSAENINTMKTFFYSGKMPEMVPAKPLTLHGGRVSAPLIGGNLATLNHLTGTPFEPDFSGHILFLEEIRESPYKIDRMLMQMRLAGCFEHIAGLMLGSFEHCGPIETIHELMKHFFGPLRVPILAGFAIGHGKDNPVLPLGLTVTLDADRQRLSYRDTLRRCLSRL
jgi:muramoyltetrapeptide carboxypeptidase